MTHIWFCSIWKLHLIPVTALGLPKFLHFQEFALILFDTSVTVWGMYIQSKLCVSSKQSSGLNEAFMGSYLLKVNSAGCALGHMVQHSSHQLDCQKHQQVLITPTDAQSSTLGWSDWNISHNRLSFQGFQAFPWPLPYLCTCVKISWRSLPKSLAAADLICGLLLLTVYWGSKACLHLQ